MSWDFSIPDFPPKDMLDVLMLPVVFAFLTVVFWASQWKATRDKGVRPKLWWFFMIPLAVMIYRGMNNVYFMTDAAYRNAYNGMRVPVAHYLSLALPFILMGILKLWSMLGRRSESF